MREYEYGPEARMDRDFESLTAKQQSVVEAITSADVDATNTEIQQDENFTDSYVSYVEERFPHIIDERRSVNRVAADGGEPVINLQLSESQVWKVIKLVGDDLSQEIYRQARRQ